MKTQAINIENLNLLNDLCYIFECLSLDYTGEAKAELNNTINRLNESSGIELPPSSIERLEHAYQLLMYQNKNESAGILSQVSRELWQSILDTDRP